MYTIESYLMIKLTKPTSNQVYTVRTAEAVHECVGSQHLGMHRLYLQWKAHLCTTYMMLYMML